MADSDKDILITPNTGQTSEPTIEFTGGDNTPLTLRVLDDGTISFEATAGQLFSISDGLSGTIFSVNDISGIPSIEVIDDGTVRLAEYNGGVAIGKSSASTALDVDGTVTATTFDGSLDWSNVANKPDPTITLGGDLSGSVTLTDLGSATLNATVSDDSHNHIISNVDGLQTALDSKVDLSGDTLTGSLNWVNQTGISAPVTAQGNNVDVPIFRVSSETLGSSGSDYGFTLKYMGSRTGNDNTLSLYSDNQNGTAVEALVIKQDGSLYQGGLTNKIWHSGNDGASSGLDSDLLDGQHGSYYLDWTNTTNKPDPTITLGGDASGSLTLTNLVGGTLTVTVADDSHNHIISNIDGLQTALDAKAPLASPTFTGTPAAPTAASGTNTTQIATTAFVATALSGVTGGASYQTTAPTSPTIGQIWVDSDETPTVLNSNDFALKDSPIFTGTVTLPSTTSIGDVSSTELGYLDGVTSAIQTQLNGKAPLASPALSGTPTAPTAASGTNTTQIATTAFVQSATAALVDSAPTTLDTLNELAAALGDDANFSTTISTSLGNKAPLASPSFTGSITLDSKVNIDTTSTAISTNTATTIDTLNASTYRSAEYLVQVTQNTKQTVSKIIMIHDGTTANISEYGVIELGGTRIPLTLSATISGSSVLLQATITDASTTNATVEVVRTAIVL